MKKIYFKKIIIAICLIAGTEEYKAQITSDTLQILIGNTIKSPKQLSIITAKIIAMPNIKYIGYCSNHKLFMLLADKNVYIDKTDFFNQLVLSTNSTELLLKEGRIEDIMNFCEYANEEDYDSVKKELDK